MGIQYIKKLIGAVCPAKYHCVPRKNKSEVKDYGPYQRKTRKEEMEKENNMTKENRDKKKQKRKQKGESKERMSKSDDEKKKRKDSKRHKDKEDKKEKPVTKRQSEKDKEEKVASRRQNEKDKEEKVASRRQSEKNKSEPVFKRRSSEMSTKSVDKEKEERKQTNKLSDSEAEADSRTEEKFTRKTNKEDDEYEFKITDVIDDGYPATPIIVVVEKNRINKPKNEEMDEKEASNDFVSCNNRTCKYRSSKKELPDRSISRKPKQSCNNPTCPTAMRRVENKPITREDIKRFEKIMMKFLESKEGCTTAKDDTRNSHRQKSGQCSSVEMPMTSWTDSPKLFANRPEDSIASLKPKWFENNEQLNLLHRKEFWQPTPPDQNQASELISIAEYWEFVPDRNVAIQGSIGSTIILDDEGYQKQADLKAISPDKTNAVGIKDIWSTGQYYRIGTPAGIMKKEKFLGGEFYRIDVPVCLSKNKCPFCKKYDLLKQGINIENIRGPNPYKGAMNPECFEYCTCMTMLDKANTSCKRKNNKSNYKVAK